MRQYVIDQLNETDYDRLIEILNKNAEGTVMEGVYWVELPKQLYSEVQSQHSQCQPFYFAVNLNRKQISFEWLIRSRATLHCNCYSYATPEQRNHIIDFADGLMEQIELRA